MYEIVRPSQLMHYEIHYFCEKFPIKFIQKGCTDSCDLPIYYMYHLSNLKFLIIGIIKIENLKIWVAINLISTPKSKETKNKILL